MLQISRQSFQQWFRDARFWIVFFFLIRLYGITLPPLEVLHNIRQTDTLMVARNFYETDNNIMYPRADVAGEKSGIVGSEFPIYNYLIYLVSVLFGFEDWYGRLINLIVSSLGILCFFSLIKKYFSDAAAFNATIVLLVSMWFTYSRKTFPDTFGASLCIAGLYFAMQFFETGKWHALVLYLLLGFAGAMSKISAAVVFAPLALPMVSSRFEISRKVLVGLCSVIILTSLYWWYFVWVPYLNTTFGFKMFFMGMGMLDGAKEIFAHWPGTLKRFYDTPLKFSGAFAILLGLFYCIKNRNWLALSVFVTGFSAFLMVMFKTGWLFVGNEYYVLVFVPFLAFIAGIGIAYLPNKRIALLFLFVICVEGIGNRFHDFRIRQPYAAMQDLESIMDSVSQRNDLIAINGSGSGTPMFFAHRKGWLVYNVELTKPEFLVHLKDHGCKYIVILKKDLWGDISLALPQVHDSEYFRIYKL